MDRNFRKETAEGAGASPPSEAWLFAQALLGKAVPSASRAAAAARAKREHLAWLADISPRHQSQLHTLQRQAAEARGKRAQLEWLAKISSRHERQLRSLLSAEAEANESQQRLKRLAEILNLQEAEWDSAKHPRGGFPQNPGWFSPSGASAGSASKLDRTGTDGERQVVDQHSAPPNMLELADAWWQTSSLLKRYRRDIERLPARIADEQAKLRSGDGHSNVHAQNLAKAQRDLERAKALVPQLEAQLSELEQEYSNAGYDKVDYWRWTPGEARVGGRGIEQVGRAVQMGGSPAGLKPTGVEFDIALAAVSVLQLGKSVLKRALGRARVNTSLGTRTEPSTSAKEVVPGRGGRYGHLEDPPTANSGNDFTSTQKKIVIAENQRQNGGVLRDDRTGELLVPGQQRRRGVQAPPNEAQVDHIYPKSKGGPNTYSNAEVRSRLSNIRKGKKLEWLKPAMAIFRPSEHCGFHKCAHSR